MPDIRPLDLSPAGLERTAGLLRVVFPEAEHLTPGYLDRLYHGNPLGETFGLCAYEAGVLVGHYLMIPIRARIYHKEERGIWPFQLATHPEHRVKGLFAEFVEQSITLCRERGYGFFMGVGNANSSPIFVRKWDYQSIRPLDVKIGVGLPPAAGDDADLDVLRLWDREAVAWRLGHPASPYRVRRRGDTAHVFAATGTLGIQAQVGELPSEWVPEQLAPLHSANPLRLWIGADPTRDWSRSLYFDVPQRFWPSPLILLCKDLTDQNRRFDPNRVRYEVFDFDAY